MKAFTLTALIALCLCISTPAGANSGDDSGGTVTNGGVTVGVKWYAPAKPGEAGVDRQEGGSTPLLTRIVWAFPPGDHSGGDLSTQCMISEKPLRIGIIYHFITLDLLAQKRDEFTYCQGTQPGVPATPPVLPTPPTVAEVWKSARIPPPDVVTDPLNRGITGLETRISTRGPRTVTVAASVPGYTVTGTATLDHYTISVDGGPEVTADHDTYTFETKGKHTIAISAVWTGTATLSGDTLSKPIFLGDIGSAVITSTLTYPVNEIRSVLQP